MSFAGYSCVRKVVFGTGGIICELQFRTQGSGGWETHVPGEMIIGFCQCSIVELFNHNTPKIYIVRVLRLPRRSHCLEESLDVDKTSLRGASREVRLITVDQQEASPGQPTITSSCSSHSYPF